MSAPIDRLAGLVAAVLILTSACSQVVSGNARPLATAPTPATPASTAQSDPAGRVAEATATALQEFWRAELPAAFGREWRDISSFTAVETQDPATPPPPCVNRAADLADQAFYCPSADAVAWDADGLIPALHDRFGPVGVAVVIAHEVGHAVQSRLGVDDQQGRDPQRFPTILLESMADCYAGAALAHFAEEPVAGLPLGLQERDKAMQALVGFRDPLGVAAGDESAHGNAFDRVSAFQDGWTEGATLCAGMTLENRTFTQRRFGSEADLARGGNLPLRELLAFVERDAAEFFGGLAPGWDPPQLSTGGACPVPELAAQGPAAYCREDGGVAVDVAALERLHEEIGDFAGATVVAGRYGIAMLDASGRSPVGTPAGAATTCLTGAYTDRLFDAAEGFQLSPGDLDEAVQVLLAADWVARDAAGASDPADHGFERIGRFRTGLLEGAAAC
ncbi:neutral zinc metallopeptidase [Pseudonocardia hierapolitana]|uniref:neutral zinc metallopeptidase n=1 Tax=Pseudonocardia hierapolitana TaxID=1128676 RepID=UPI001478E6A0|nr:neutral zinc metallopeptidase [Pseudonocardia hierapolitana]